MKIYCLKEDALIFLKSNCKNQLDLYKSTDNQLLLNSYDDNPFIETRFEIEDFELDMSSDKPALTDCENVKRLYNSLNFLSESQASDERLWAGLAINDFWKYIQYRWGIQEKCTENNIKSHFYFNYNNRRSYTRNGISRLWWIGKLTFDEENNNPYELTEYICRHSDFILHLLERSQSNNKNIVKEILYALLDLEREGISVNTDEFGELIKYMNRVGGTYLLDCLPERGIYERTKQKVKKMKVK